MIALIPARGGSKRVPRKNVKLLGGQPLIAWTIAAAKLSGVFTEIGVSTDDDETCQIAWDLGVKTWRRPAALAHDSAPDIAWVREVFKDPTVQDANAFAILRPTSPFRTDATIQRAYQQFKRQEVHSIRAVEPVRQHPGKMWQMSNGCLWPLIGKAWPAPGKDMQSIRTYEDTPWHSQPTQILPQVYVQNASLEMAWTYVVKAFGTISGTKIAPFYTHGSEGFDINTPDDWREAERLVQEGLVEFPRMDMAGVSPATPEV